MLEEEPGKGSTPGKERQLEKLRRDCGGEFLIALEDSKTIEIVLNADGILWQERLGEGMRGIGGMKPSRAEAIIRTVASMLGVIVRWDRPLLEGELPLDGSRFAAQLPPVVSSPTFAIRKKASAVYTLAEYVQDGIMTLEQKDVLCDAVANHRNVLVSGSTGA